MKWNAFVIGDLDNSLTEEFLEKKLLPLLEKNNVRISNRKEKLRFCLKDLYASNLLVVLPYEKIPEVYFSIGFGLAKGKYIISFWTSKKEKLKRYGFYDQLNNTMVFSLDELIEKIKNLKFREEKHHNPPKVKEKLNVYIAGDVRTKVDQKKLYYAEKLIKKLGHRGLNPTRLVNFIKSLEKHYKVKNIFEIPSKRHWRFLESEEGTYKTYPKVLLEIMRKEEIKEYLKLSRVERCFYLLRKSHAIFSEIYKPYPIGPWIEIGYAVGLGIPVIGFNGYDWKKVLKGKIYSELREYNKKFGIKRWIVETKKELREILKEILRYYQKISG